MKILNAAKQADLGSLVRESSIVAIVTNLEAISIANGYTLDVKKVIRLDAPSKLAKTAHPALMVIDNDDEERLPKAGGFADVYFTLNIKGIINSGTESSTAMNALDVAIKKAISADRTLSGTVANVSILPRLETDLDGDERDAAFTRPVQVYYEANEANGE